MTSESDLEIIKQFTQFGFEAVLILIILIGCGFMGMFVVKAFTKISEDTKQDIKEITSLHRDDMREMGKDHREERQECHNNMKSLVEEIRRIGK